MPTGSGRVSVAALWWLCSRFECTCGARSVVSVHAESDAKRFSGGWLEKVRAIFHDTLSALPRPDNNTGSRHDGKRKERSESQGAAGQGRRWHGQCQGEGRELLPVRCIVHRNACALGEKMDMNMLFQSQRL